MANASTRRAVVIGLLVSVAQAMGPADTRMTFPEPSAMPRDVLRAMASRECISATMLLHAPVMVADIVARHLHVDEDRITAGTPYHTLGLDALDAVEIVMDLEQAFNISIHDDEADSVVLSFPATMAYLQSRQCR